MNPAIDEGLDEGEVSGREQLETIGEREIAVVGESLGPVQKFWVHGAMPAFTVADQGTDQLIEGPDGDAADRWDVAAGDAFEIERCGQVVPVDQCSGGALLESAAETPLLQPTHRFDPQALVMATFHGWSIDSRWQQAGDQGCEGLAGRFRGGRQQHGRSVPGLRPRQGGLDAIAEHVNAVLIVHHQRTCQGQRSGMQRNWSPLMQSSSTRIRSPINDSPTTSNTGIRVQAHP